MDDKKYEIINMKICFILILYMFFFKILCLNGNIENFDIYLDCEGEYLYGNYMLYIMCYLKLM